MKRDDAGWFERVFGPDDAKGAKYGCVGIIVIFVVGLGSLPTLCSTETAPPITNTIDASDSNPIPAAYTPNQLSMICKAGIAAEFGRNPKIMTSREIEPGMMRIEYRRPDDPKLWKNDCRVEGNRIVWRTVDASPGSGTGRWRTSENDDVLTFKLDGNAVTTESSDGSSASETYRF
jgi:hypothetical protein